MTNDKPEDGDPIFGKSWDEPWEEGDPVFYGFDEEPIGSAASDSWLGVGENGPGNFVDVNIGGNKLLQPEKPPAKSKIKQFCLDFLYYLVMTLGILSILHFGHWVLLQLEIM